MNADSPLLADLQQGPQLDLASLVKDNRMRIDVLDHATPASLHHKLVTGRYDIVHFIGHGYWDRGVSGLVLEDESKERFDLDERNLREMFAGRRLRVVFLNACDTGRGKLRQPGLFDRRRGAEPVRPRNSSRRGQ
jgi:CHAT domain-containing protein